MDTPPAEQLDQTGVYGDRKPASVNGAEGNRGPRFAPREVSPLRVSARRPPMPTRRPLANDRADSAELLRGQTRGEYNHESRSE